MSGDGKLTHSLLSIDRRTFVILARLHAQFEFQRNGNENVCSDLHAFLRIFNQGVESTH